MIIRMAKSTVYYPASKNQATDLLLTHSHPNQEARYRWDSSILLNVIFKIIRRWSQNVS